MGGQPESLDEDKLLADSDDHSSSSDENETTADKQIKALQRAKAASYFNENDDEGNSSSSDSSESEEDNDETMEVDEDLLQAELTVVNDKLAAEPYSYDLYVDKIRILKSLGELDRLRDVREKMSQLYPLSPSLWVDWIKDEQKMLTTKEEKDYVIKLMDRAVKDYCSVEVWLEYVNFCLGQMHEDATGVDTCRHVFERALGNCGLNVAMGSLIWDTYRNFEAALLATKTSENEQTEQEKRFVSLCKRQLAVPLLHMSNTFEQISTALDVDENTEAAYKKALHRLKELETWEAKLIQTSDIVQKVQVYKDYIEEEKKYKSNPARIQCLYERAITDSPLDVTVWIEYIDYLSKNLKFPDLILETADRASRNCPWVLSVWTKYMWAVETFLEGDKPDADSVFDKIKSVFESAIMYCGTADQAGTLWLKYIEFLRRRVDPLNPDQKKVEVLRKTFSAAELHLLQLVQEPNDFLCQILQFNVRFEASLAKGMTEEIRKMWKDLFARGYSSNYRVWSQYISQELKFGTDVKKIRIELGRAMSQIQDDPHSIADIWLNFERDNGDINTLTTAEAKISKVLEKSAQSLANNNYDQHQQYVQSQYQHNSKGKFAQTLPKGKKRKLNEAVSTTFSPKQGKQVQPLVDDQVDGTFKVPALPGAMKLSSASNTVKVKEIKSEGLKNNLPPGPVKHDPSKDHRTVFISNLDFKIEDEAIKNFFQDCGTIDEVRLVRDFKGRSKGFGYVFFDKSDSVQNALKKDRQPLEGRPAFVSKCDPDKSTRQVQFKYSTELEKNKLFVKGLPFSMTAEELKKLFEEFGTLKDCRLVTHRNGHSKGIAYVEFTNAASASAAILKTDGQTMDGMVLSVAISNPPSKNKPLQFHSSTFSKQQDSSQRRTKNVFVPRALQVHPTTTADASKKSITPKTNDEFRKMFMKN